MDHNGLGLGLPSSTKDWVTSHQMAQYHGASLGAVVKLPQ